MHMHICKCTYIVLSSFATTFETEREAASELMAWLSQELGTRDFINIIRVLEDCSRRLIYYDQIPIIREDGGLCRRCTWFVLTHIISETRRCCACEHLLMSAQEKGQESGTSLPSPWLNSSWEHRIYKCCRPIVASSWIVYKHAEQHILMKSRCRNSFEN